MGTDEMRRIAAWMTRVIDNPDDEAVSSAVRHEVEDFAAGYPVPGQT